MISNHDVWTSVDNQLNVRTESFYRVAAMVKVIIIDNSIQYLFTILTYVCRSTKVKE